MLILNIIKLSKIEAIAFIIIIMINQVILGAPKTILSNSASGSLLNVLFISIIAILLVLFINYLFGIFQNSDIIDVSEKLAGKALKFIISLGFIGLFLLSSITCLCCICQSLKIIYFPDTNLIYLALFFIIPIIFANRKGFSSISKVNLIIVFISIR